MQHCHKGEHPTALSQIGQDSTCAKGKHCHWRQRPVQGLLLGRKLLLQPVQHGQDPPYGAITPHYQHPQACKSFQPSLLDKMAAAAALYISIARRVSHVWHDAHTRPFMCMVL